jgi:hypothetical protein
MSRKTSTDIMADTRPPPEGPGDARDIGRAGARRKTDHASLTGL